MRLSEKHTKRPAKIQGWDDQRRFEIELLEAGWNCKRRENTSQDNDLENQCESSKTAIFPMYFNRLKLWCPEEASH